MLLCILKPEFRLAYLEKTAKLLQEKSKLVGLFFAEHFSYEVPPYGRTKCTLILILKN